ncbi:MAG TPA: hypothetical protein VHJ69_00330 [Gemmatimonadales bacterium]|jgi:hypothetical protein|nr:hypothetical protein [Gemmatimonadales bacterium]
MLRFLRGHRLLPLALLLATPGVGGNLLQAVHTCPVQAPWLSQSGTPADAHHHSHDGSDRSAPGDCQCIGACHKVSAWASPAGGPTVALALVAPVAFAHRADVAVAPAARPYYFLPPATAPPLA